MHHTIVKSYFSINLAYWSYMMLQQTAYENRILVGLKYKKCIQQMGILIPNYPFKTVNRLDATRP